MRRTLCGVEEMTGMTREGSMTNKRTKRRRPRERTKAKSYGRVGGLGLLFLAATVTLAACGGPVSPHVANLGSGNGNNTADTTTTAPTGNPTALVDQWAACMRRHGDPQQADPSIDPHGVINIRVPMSFSSHQFGEDLHNIVGTCSQYLGAAQRVLREEIPYTPFNPDNAVIVQYADCMRTHGVANYPTGEGTNLLGINMNSPTFIRANSVCGRQIHAPAWWINGWGPPGDVSSSSGPTGNLPHATPVPAGG